jgi:hypothetical protein
VGRSRGAQGATERPHRITLASVAELPFGRGRRFGDGWNAVVDGILGGWQFSTKYEWQSGSPLVFNQNTYFDLSCGDPRDLKSDWSSRGDQRAGVDLGASGAVGASGASGAHSSHPSHLSHLT